MSTSIRGVLLGVLPGLCWCAASYGQAKAVPAPVPAPSAAQGAEVRDLDVEVTAWKGDFDAMVKRRMVRVLVPYSRTLYFNDKGQERGITADNVRDFERWINQQHRDDKRPITVYIVPTTRDKLLSLIASGHGDIAAGNLTVTEARGKLVDFYVSPKQKQGTEIVVTGPKAPKLASLEDLSGKTVHVRKATSYYESLLALNARFKAAKKPPVKILLLPDALEDEDKLEMVNAGLIDISVVDDWRGEMWQQVLPNITLHPDLKLRENVKVGWAVRKGSPQLVAAIDDFNRNFLIKQGVSNYRLAQYSKRIKQIQNPTQDADWKRFEATLKLFGKYGKQYGFDPVMLAAQGYQESRLDQGAKSHVGAVGVMQIMPATGKELAVGDIHQVEANIHGGAKYMDQLMTRYFKDAHFDEDNRSLFAFAAYNAGPGRIGQMRREAAKRGLNPDKWFNNVEVVTAEKVGIETTTYVRNIYKYYVAYKMTMAINAQKEVARKQVGGT